VTPNDLLKKCEKALEIQNWHDVEPLLHRDAGVTFSSGTFKDKKEVQHAFENTFNLIKEEKYSITNVTWIHSDVTFAVCLYNFNWRD